LSSRARRCLIEPSTASSPGSPDNVEGDLIVHQNDLITDDGTCERFRARLHYGKGEFGRVYRVSLEDATPPVSFALKVSKADPDSIGQFRAEALVLTDLCEPPDPPEFADAFDSILRLHSHFEFRGHYCIVTECLHHTLLSILRGRRFYGFGPDLVQSVVRDLLKPLVKLARLRLVHSDVKPENILQVALTSSHVKLIDFGSACHEDDRADDYAQTRFYRSPEVVLRLPRTTKSDMWSLGCVIAELTLGIPLLAGTSEIHQVYLINEMFGPFPRQMVEESPRRDELFDAAGALKSKEELSAQLVDEDRQKFLGARPFFVEKRLDGIIMSLSSKDGQSEELKSREVANLQSLTRLLKRILVIDPNERAAAIQILGDPFLAIDFGTP
jgi:dual specificity protein kinase YAK1